MAIRYKCLKCGVTLKIKDKLAGKPGKCPKCRTRFVVPTLKSLAPKTSAGSEEEEAFQHLMEQLGEPMPSQQPTATPIPEKPASGGDYFRSQPTAASDIAGDLLTRTGKRSQKTDWRSALKHPVAPTKASQAYREYLRHSVVKAIGIVAGIVLLTAGAWWAGSRFLGGYTDLPDLGQVTGVVTLDDEPLVRAMVTFVPIPPPGEATAGVSESYGKTDEDGVYELTYKKDVTGAAIGEHKVEITASPSSRILLPTIYNDHTELRAEVKAGNNVHNFRLKSKL